MNFYKKLLFLLLSTHITFSNDQKNYFTTQNINPVHIGITFITTTLLVSFMFKCLQKKVDNHSERIGVCEETLKKTKIKLQDVTLERDTYKNLWSILYRNKAIIRVGSTVQMALRNYSSLVEEGSMDSNSVITYKIKESK